MPEIIPAVIVGVVGLGLILGAGTAIGTTASADGNFHTNLAAQEEQVTAEEAQHERERAFNLLAELEELAEDDFATISGTDIRAVNNRIEDGNLSYDRANYAAAKENYIVAQERAEAALISGYDEAVNAYLNATATHLGDLRADGYTSAELAQYEERVKQLKSQTPTGLGEYRALYNDARRLDDESRDELPSPFTVQLAHLLSPVRLLLVVAGIFIVFGPLSAWTGYKLGRRTAPAETGDEDEERSTTTSTMRG